MKQTMRDLKIEIEFASANKEEEKKHYIFVTIMIDNVYLDIQVIELNPISHQKLILMEQIQCDFIWILKCMDYYI